MRNNTKNAIYLGLVVAIATGQSAGAATLDYTAGVSAVYSNNIDRQPSDGLDELIVSPALGFDFSSEGGKFEGEARGDIRYLDYTKNTFGNETLAAFGGSGVFTLRPDTLTWTVEDNFGQIVTDPFMAITPGNREDINFFTTGPDLTLRLGGANSVSLGGRFSDESYETTPSDNQQYTGYLGLGRALRSGRNVSLNASTTRVEFDQMATNSNYDVNSAFVKFESATSRSDLVVDLGATQLHDNGMKNSNALVNIAYTRTLSGASSLALTASSRFNETGQAFRATQGDASVVQGTQDVIAGGDPFRHKGASADYRFLDERFDFGVGGRWSDDDYETNNTFDRRIYGASVRAGYTLNARSNLLFTGTVTRTDFVTTNQEDDDVGATLEFSQQLGRSVSVIFGVSHFSRDSNVATTNYDENRGTLRFEYTR